MSKEAMKLALEALAVKFSEGWHEGIKIDASDIMLLNDAAQALASEAKEQPAPVAKPHEQEPVGYVAENGVVDWNICAPPIMTDLYTSPPAQRTWVGLTDEEIINVAKSIDIEFKDEGLEAQIDDILTFARAIEAAHGIKENT